MSRHFVTSSTGTILRPKTPAEVHGHSPAWKQKRQQRSERRRENPQVIEQSRQAEGFLIKVDDTGSTILFDPGPIDRQLWCEANAAREAEKIAEGKKQRGKKHGK